MHTRQQKVRKVGMPKPMKGHWANTGSLDDPREFLREVPWVHRLAIVPREQKAALDPCGTRAELEARGQTIAHLCGPDGGSGPVSRKGPTNGDRRARTCPSRWPSCCRRRQSRQNTRGGGCSKSRGITPCTWPYTSAHDAVPGPDPAGRAGRQRSEAESGAECTGASRPAHRRATRTHGSTDAMAPKRLPIAARYENCCGRLKPPSSRFGS